MYYISFMDDFDENPSELIRDVRLYLTKSFAIIYFSLSLIVLLLNSYKQDYDGSALYAAMFVGLIGFVLHKLEKYRTGELLSIGGFLLIVYLGSYAKSSASGFSLTAFTILITLLMDNKKLPHVIFFLNIFVALLFVYLDVFTFQRIDAQVEGIALNNNVQVSIVGNIFAYALTILFQKTLINTVELQKKQYSKLKNYHELSLAQAQYDTIKILAGGIAHDFNNILTIMTGNIGLIQQGYLNNNELEESFKEINNASLNARNLANKLLNLTRGNYGIFEDIHFLDDMIRSTVNFTLKGSKSIASFEIVDDLWGIHGDIVQFSQIIQNLVINADQSMTDGGLIRIVAKNKVIERDNPLILQAGEYVEFHVIDQGTGIPAELSHKIFDLFFSTKKEGSGIGLAVCKNILKFHKGFIGYKNNADGGTDFYFYIPRAKSQNNVQVKPQDIIKTKFDGTAVVYDDNLNILKTYRIILNKLGMKVFDSSTSSSLISLIQTLKSKNERVDIFILDLVMPGDLGGEKMVDIIREEFDNALIVVSSGFSNEFILSEYKSYKFDSILRKPCDINDFIEILKKIRK